MCSDTLQFHPWVMFFHLYTVIPKLKFILWYIFQAHYPQFWDGFYLSGYRSTFWGASPLLHFHTLALCLHMVFSDKQGKRYLWVSFHKTSQYWKPACFLKGPSRTLNFFSISTIPELSKEVEHVEMGLILWYYFTFSLPWEWNRAMIENQENCHPLTAQTN